jgi:hypothetical protein
MRTALVTLRLVAAGGLLAGLLLARPLAAQPPPARDARARDTARTPADTAWRGRFYGRRPYGSERQFNPLSQLVNEGFNNLVLYNDDLGLTRQPWTTAWRNLSSSLGNILPAYRRAGWSRVIRNELLPLTGREGGQWVPNYQDHLLGSGMVSVRMMEWFAAHGFAHPAWWSYGAMTASHVLNELVEQPNPRSVDAISDLVIFDNLGFLLFRNARVQRAFSERVAFTSWAWQPVLTGPGGAVENAGQSFVLRFPLRRHADGAGADRHVRGFYLWGVTHVLGLSHPLAGGRALSWGVGAGAKRVTVADTVRDFRTITIGPRAGLFLDREGSLLASLVWEDNDQAIATLNVFPGVLRVAGHSLGLWASLQRGTRVRVGITAPWGLGLGVGQPRPLGPRLPDG